MSGMIADHRRNLGGVGKIETLAILQISPRPFQTIGDIYDFNFSLVGKIWDGRETVKSIPYRPGFSRDMETRLLKIFLSIELVCRVA